ncbi:MAG: hypothetical protein OXJ64_19450 [Boseongicola sp.]|nr:hypothetical protein [Boseongicola sp.]
MSPGTTVPTNVSLAHAIARLPVVLDLMRKELTGLPAGFLNPQECAELKDSAVEVFREGAAALRGAVARHGADMQPPGPYEWLKPLVEFREKLATTLDAVADSLRNGGTGSGQGK